MEKGTFSGIRSSDLKVEASNVLNGELSCSLRRGSKLIASNISNSSKDSNGSNKQPMRACKFPSCDYRSDKQSNFNRHLITMHRQLKSQVICCDLSFKTKGELRHHTRTVHETGHRCRLCGKIFNRKALLERHVSIHTGKKPYRCSLCDYASANKANVIRHLSIHKPDDAKITFNMETLNNSQNKMETPSSSSSRSSSSVSSNETKLTSVSLTCSSSSSPANSSLSFENPFTQIKSEEAVDEERNKVKSKVWISHSIDSILGKSGKPKTSQLPSTKGQKSLPQAHQNFQEQERIYSVLRLLPEPASRKSEKENHQHNLDNWPQTNAEMSPGFNWTHTSPLPGSLPPYPHNHLPYHHHSNLSPLPATYFLQQCQSRPPPPASLDMMTMMMNQYQYQYQYSAQHQRYAPSINRTGSDEKVVNESPPARPAQEVGSSSGNNSNNNGRIILNETTMMREFELKTEEIEQEVVVDDTAYVPKKLRTCKKFSVAEG